MKNLILACLEYMVFFFFATIIYAGMDALMGKEYDTEKNHEYFQAAMFLWILVKCRELKNRLPESNEQSDLPRSPK